VALRKNLLKNKATVVLNVSDIFNTRKYTTIYDYPLYTQTTYRDRETRIGNISLTYRFGKSEKQEPRGMGNAPGRKRGAKEESVPKTKDRDNLKTDESNDSGGQG
jgi:hypothetical protein